MLNDLIEIIADSKTPKLRLTIEVTPNGLQSALHDRNGQRGSAISGIPKRHWSGDTLDHDTLDGQAKFLIEQEARRALRADR